MSAHSILPELLTRAAGAVLEAAGIRHVAHGRGNAVEAARAAAADPEAHALLGPYQSAEAAEAVEATAPAALALLAPVATWAGVTRDDDRPTTLTALRRLGGFDAHGDPTDPPVWLWRADAACNLEPDRPLA